MSEQLFDFWCKEVHEENEDSMERQHQRGWQEFIEQIDEDISQARILDFGCNQGGLLRALYARKPFKQGVGIDLARAAIAIAEERKGDLPLRYVATGMPETLGEQFDLCISSSVLYFIDDFAAHAKSLHQVLTEGGHYYASFTDFNGSELLPYWTNMLLREGAKVPFRVQSLDEIITSFANQGFTVGVKRSIPNDYVPIEPIPGISAKDQIQIAYEKAYMLKFTKTL